MKNSSEIEHFLKHEVLIKISTLAPDATPLWGSMSGRQLVEHLALPFKASNGKLIMYLTSPPEKLEKIKAIGLTSDRPFQRNYNNVLIGPMMKEFRNTDIKGAVEELEIEMNAFFDLFQQKGKEHLIMHNVFGELNYQEWLWFHYKHLMHHFMQFQLVPLANRIT